MSYSQHGESIRLLSVISSGHYEVYASDEDNDGSFLSLGLGDFVVFKAMLLVIMPTCL